MTGEQTTVKAIATTLAAMLAVVLALPSVAQSQVPAFCLADDPGDPDYDIADYDPVRDSDDWCKLAYHQPHKARRQLAKAVSLVRSENNPNRFYWDPRHGGRAGEYIQLMRPWMGEENTARTGDWQILQAQQSRWDTVLLVADMARRDLGRYFNIRFAYRQPAGNPDGNGDLRAWYADFLIRYRASRQESSVDCEIEPPINAQARQRERGGLYFTSTEITAIVEYVLGNDFPNCE